MFENATKAVTLLLALAVGGIALPLAHQVDHLLDALAVEAVADGVVVDNVPTGSLDHDCELCEARVIAVGTNEIGATALAAMDMDVVQEAPVELPSSAQAFQGRAPPVTA